MTDQILQTITVGQFTLKITKENDRHYTGICSGCGLVTPTKTKELPLGKWFIWHLNGFKSDHGVTDSKDIPMVDTMWRIN